MTEGEPAALPEPIPLEAARARRGGKRGRQRWNIAGVSQQLRAAMEPFSDEQFGDGNRWAIGMAGPVTTLELYNKSAAARIRTQGMLIELAGVATPLVAEEEMPSDEESVVLVSPAGANDLRVGLSAQGDVSLFVAPHQALEATPSPPAPVEVSDDKAPEQLSETEAQVRVSIQGRVGAAPTFRSTPKGVLIARFPLAERQEEATIWHQILAFGRRAEGLREALKKGQLVDIVGYLHERPARNNADRVVREIYAVVVRPAQSHR